MGGWLAGGFLLAFCISCVYYDTTCLWSGSFELGGWPTGLMLCTSREHMGGLLYSLNFFFLYWAERCSLCTYLNITALIKMVGGWAGLVWVWAWASGLVGWAELLLKDSSVSFVHLRMRGLDCNAMRWMEGR